MAADGPVTVAALQLDFRGGEGRAARVGRVVDLLGSAPPADLLVLPELWDVAYFDFDAYEAAGHRLGEGPVAAVATMAAERRCTVVAGSVLERSEAGLHNTVVVVGPDGQVLGTYRKRHLFGLGSREAELLVAGATDVVVDTPAGRLGLATCFDLRFPGPFAAARAAGADVVVVPAAWPAARADHWRVLARARAIETQTPVVAVNGVGDCAGTPLAGSTAVVDARGVVLVDAGAEPGWHRAVLDPADTAAWRAELPLTP